MSPDAQQRPQREPGARSKVGWRVLFGGRWKRDEPLRRAGRIILAALVGVGVAAGISTATADNGRRMDGWYAYDYREGLDVEPAVNVFREATEVDGAVWVGHRRWSIDDPESPPSVLALVRYDAWDTSGGYVATSHTAGDDLTDTTVCFDLRGRELDLHGGHITFWVMSSTTGQRWHYEAPLDVSGQWTEQKVDTSGEWRNSWRWSPDAAPDLAATLAHGNSYGVAFVGFDHEQEPTGRLGMRDFRIGC